MPENVAEAELVERIKQELVENIEAELVARIKRELRDDLLQSSAVTPGIGHNRGPPLADPPVYDTLGFCAAHKVSRAQLYVLWKEGRGPKFYRIGTSVRITGESAAAWRREREAASQRVGDQLKEPG